jgi:hypothetical protein
MHYVKTVAGWQRGKLSVERMTIEQAREELGRTFERHKGRPWRSCQEPPAMVAPTRARSKRTAQQALDLEATR